MAGEFAKSRRWSSSRRRGLRRRPDFPQHAPPSSPRSARLYWPRSVTSPAAATAPSRLVAVDVFRGATMAAMVIVNTPGDWGAVFPPLLHADWHGWTPTDLIFPFFVYIVGVSIVLSAR